MSLRFVEYKPGVASSLADQLSSHYLNQPMAIVVNYGNSQLEVRGDELVLNHPDKVRECIDKPLALARLRDASNGLFVVPAVLEPCMVVKRKHHRGGKGHILVSGETHYAEEFVPCAQEWRVHVVGERTCARLKTGGTGELRNRRHGWMFMYSDDVPQVVRDAARTAVHLLGLDFGAVDVGDRGPNSPGAGATSNLPVVYEVNTAPRLQVDEILDWYRRNLIRLIDSKTRR